MNSCWMWEFQCPTHTFLSCSCAETIVNVFLDLDEEVTELSGCTWKDLCYKKPVSQAKFRSVFAWKSFHVKGFLSRSKTVSTWCSFIQPLPLTVCRWKSFLPLGFTDAFVAASKTLGLHWVTNQFQCIYNTAKCFGVVWKHENVLHLCTEPLRSWSNENLLCNSGKQDVLHFWRSESGWNRTKWRRWQKQRNLERSWSLISDMLSGINRHELDSNNVEKIH